MPSPSDAHPVRRFIRHKAQQKITTTLKAELDWLLFQDLVSTVLQPPVNPAIYTGYASREQAEAVEDQVASAIASAYLRLWQRRQNAEVQRLNQLLDSPGAATGGYLG
ncbi:MAG TPA: hypothetical protein IGR64_18185 [Leptolyngbyaceae cyanobacterium M65_K2018_010]|nr:hypothetical protein [Leptolyngbyaceae cyanobacterium M65_K2018_010]